MRDETGDALGATVLHTAEEIHSCHLSGLKGTHSVLYISGGGSENTSIMQKTLILSVAYISVGQPRCICICSSYSGNVFDYCAVVCIHLFPDEAI